MGLLDSLAPFAGPAVGGLLGYLGSRQSNNSATSTYQNEPSSLARPYYQDILSNASNLYDVGTQPFFPGQTYAGYSPEQLQSQQMMLGYANQLGGQNQQGFSANNQLLNNQFLQGAGGFLPGAIGAYGSLLDRNNALPTGGPTIDDASRSAYLGMLSPVGNPYLDQQVSRAQNTIGRNFTEQIMPAIRDEAIFTGQYGGSRPGLAANMGLEQTQRAMGDVATNMYGQAYSSDMNRALQAAGALTQAQQQATANQINTSQQGITNQMNAANALGGLYGTGLEASSRGIGNLPALTNLGLLPSQLYGQVGTQNQAQSQAAIDEARARYTYPLESQRQNLNWYSALVGGLPLGVSGTQSNTSPQANPLTAAAGGALLGYGLFGNQQPQSQGGYGAAAGGQAFGSTANPSYQQLYPQQQYNPYTSLGWSL